MKGEDRIEFEKTKLVSICQHGVYASVCVYMDLHVCLW